MKHHWYKVRLKAAVSQINKDLIVCNIHFIVLTCAKNNVATPFVQQS